MLLWKHLKNKGSAAPRVAEPLTAAPLSQSSPPADLDRWYYARGRGKIGPIATDGSRSLVASGQVQASTMVLKDGTKQWMKADAVKEFGLPAATPAVIPSADWYYGKDGKTLGPVSTDAIRKLLRDGLFLPIFCAGWARKLGCRPSVFPR